MALVESAALGKPILLANTCEIHQLFESANAGVVVPLDEQKIAQGLDMLVSDNALRCSLSIRAREVARDRFSMKTIGNQLEDIYNRVIAL